MNSAPNLTPHSLQQYQSVIDTSRKDLPSKLKGLPDSYVSYILACISIQRRYLPHNFQDKDVLLQLFLVYPSLLCLICRLLNAAEADSLLLSPSSPFLDLFPAIRVVSPLPDQVLTEISATLKAIYCIYGNTPLFEKCRQALLSTALSSNSESVLLLSFLMNP